MNAHNHQPDESERIHPVLTLVLTVAVAALVLGMAVQAGYGLIAAFEPEQADAAPVETATPIVTAITPAPTLRPTDAPPRMAPPTSTPLPTPTMEPTPIPPTATPTVPRLIAASSGVNVRLGPSTSYEKVGFLDSGNEALITGWSGIWWQVNYQGQPAYISGEFVTAFDTEAVPEVALADLPGPTLTHPVFEPAPVWAIDEARWIDVDLSEQRVTAYEAQTPIKSYLVSTGLPGTPTPEGQFRIWVKFRYDDMAGEDYYLKDVPWVMYFYQGYGFHGVWWHANWGHPMSHGCVNQPNEMAEWLFDFADVGTLVNVHE